METAQIGTDGGAMSLVTDPKDGLPLLQLERMLSDIRFQPKWREKAAEAADYYDGNQLTEERLARMTRLGIPPLITNLIAPAIDAVLGMEAKTRTDARVTQENEVQEVPEMMLEALNVKLNEAEHETRSDRAISDAYAGEIKTGMDWVEVSRSTDALAYPYRVNRVHRDEIWWDWRSKMPDLSDARWLVRKRSFDQDVLMAIMPEHADLIQFAVQEGFRSWQWDTKHHIDTRLALAAEVERITNIDALEWRNAERRRAMVYEVWYREWVRGEVLRLPNGKNIPFDKKDIRQLAAVQAGVIRPQPAVYTNVRVAFYLGPHRLYDMPSPYQHRHFPYVPFWGYREDLTGVPYGLIRRMMSPQDVVNSSDSKMHWMLNSRRLRADSDAIDTRFNTWENVRENLARADSVVLLDPNKPNSRFREDNDNGLTAEQFNRRQQSAKDIQSTGGVFNAQMGHEMTGQSGIAVNSLVEQGNITLAEINDNYQFARRQVHELLFSLVREDMLKVETPVAWKKEGKRKFFVLNQQLQNGEVQNAVADTAVKVVLAEVPSTPSFRAQQLMMLTEITKSLPPQFQSALIDLVIGLTDVPEKEKVLDRLRKVAGIQPDMTPEQEAAMAQEQQAEQAQQKDMIQKMQAAQLALAEAKAQQTQSMADKANVEKLAKMVEAMYAALQAAQIVATVPNTAPVADEILKGAGYQNVEGGQNPNIPEPAQPQLSMPVTNGDGQPAGTDIAPTPAQHRNMLQGIETARADGMQQPN